MPCFRKTDYVPRLPLQLAVNGNEGAAVTATHETTPQVNEF